MTKEETTATWQSWLLDAIHKIRYQKQRPNVERVAACIRMHHPQYSNEAVEEHLEQCVENGSVAKIVNKGLVSYRDPGKQIFFWLFSRILYKHSKCFKRSHLLFCFVVWRRFTPSTKKMAVQSAFSNSVKM